MFQQIFLDKDGVIVDFDEGLRRRYNVAWYPTEFKLPYKLFGMTFDEFWKDMEDPTFWAELPWHNDGKRIQAILEPFKPTILSAAFNAGTIQGKLEWLSKEYPDTMAQGQHRVLLANGHEAKAAIAGPGKILIDDRNLNIDQWTAAGGTGILYPRPWNRFRAVNYPIEFLMSSLMNALGGK